MYKLAYLISQLISISKQTQGRTFAQSFTFLSPAHPPLSFLYGAILLGVGERGAYAFQLIQLKFDYQIKVIGQIKNSSFHYCQSCTWNYLL